jgi:hypothetical protein
MKRQYGIAGNGRASAHLQAYFRLLKVPYKLWHRRSGRSPEAILAPCQTVFILLKDSAIAPFIAAHPFLKDKRLIHFSGSLTVEGAAAMHPFMPLSSRRLTLREYRAIPFALEPGVSMKELVPEFLNPVFTVRKEDKALYHALCALGANLPVMLWQRTLTGLRGFGVPPKAVQAYFRASLDNFMQDPAGALTGPIARADYDAVSADIKALGGDPFASVYSAFAQAHSGSPAVGRNAKTASRTGPWPCRIKRYAHQAPTVRALPRLSLRAAQAQASGRVLLIRPASCKSAHLRGPGQQRRTIK